MANEVSIYEPRTMGRVVQKLPPVRTFFRSTFFKHEETFTTKNVDVDFRKGSRKVAPFVSRLIGGKVVPNTGYETKTYTPPLVAPEKVTTVDDLLQRRPGESIYSGRTPAERAVLKMADDFVELREQIVRREELMCAQTILTGKIPIIGDGVNEEIDFFFTNKETISEAKKKWTADTSDPIADLKRWHETVQKTGFVNCDICVMGTGVANAFVGNAKVQKVLDVKNYNLAVIQPRQLPNGYNVSGNLTNQGLIFTSTTNGIWTTGQNPAAPEDKPLVPADSLALLSTSSDYSMYYGAITLIKEPDGNFMTVEGKYVPDTWTKAQACKKISQSVFRTVMRTA